MISHEVAPSGIAYVTLGLDVSIIPSEDAVGMTTPRSYQVRTRIRGRYSVRAFLDEKAYGVTSLESYSTILEAVESDWKNLVIRLQDLRDSILKGNRGGMLLYITDNPIKHLPLLTFVPYLTHLDNCFATYDINYYCYIPL